MAERCNVTQDEAEELLSLFPAWDNEQELYDTLFEHYLFYHRKGRKRLCYCGACGSVYRSKDAFVHNDSVVCERCGARVTAKATGRLGKGGTFPSLTDSHAAVMLSAAPDGALLASYAAVRVEYEWAQWGNDDPEEPIFPVPKLDVFERARYYFRPGKVGKWKRRCGVYNGLWCFDYYDETNWKQQSTCSEPTPANCILHTQLDEGCYRVYGWDAIADTDMRYSQAVGVFDPAAGQTRDLLYYLGCYTKRPQLEMLYKLGHLDVISDLLAGNLHGHALNWRARRPDAFFRLSKQDYRAFADSGGSLDMLLQYAQVAQLISFTDYCQQRTLCRLRPGVLANGLTLAKEAGVSLPALNRYLSNLQSIGMWTDYIRMGEQLNYDFRQADVLMPKNLRERHDAAAEAVEYQEDVEAVKRYRKRYRKLVQTYEMEAAGYRIIVPRTASAIRAEGRELRHCVGGYAQRHCKGATTILFLRRADAPDTSLCTIEMMADGVTIQQIHGFRNDFGAENPRQTYKEFLDIWLPWLADGSQRDGHGAPLLPEPLKEAM